MKLTFEALEELIVEEIDREPSRYSTVEAKKKRKKQCHAYNPSHSGKTGQFVNPEKESGSYSMKAPDAGSPPGCTHGKSSRKSANRKRTATKLGCGRGEKYVCHSGKAKWEEALGEDVGDEEIIYLKSVIQQELAKFLNDLKTTMKQRQSTNSSACTIPAMLKFINRFELATSGKLTSKK